MSRVKEAIRGMFYLMKEDPTVDLYERLRFGMRDQFWVCDTHDGQVDRLNGFHIMDGIESGVKFENAVYATGTKSGFCYYVPIERFLDGRLNIAKNGNYYVCSLDNVIPYKKSNIMFNAMSDTVYVWNGISQAVTAQTILKFPSNIKVVDANIVWAEKDPYFFYFVVQMRFCLNYFTAKSYNLNFSYVLEDGDPKLVSIATNSDEKVEIVNAGEVFKPRSQSLMPRILLLKHNSWVRYLYLAGKVGFD